MPRQFTTINLSRKTTSLPRSPTKTPNRETSPRIPITDVPEVPARITTNTTKSMISKSGERVKNKSLIRIKRASLDAGADYVNEAEMVKNYYEMKGKLGP